MAISDSSENGFLDHLEELRTVLLRVIILIVILFPVCYYFAPQVLQLLVAYLAPQGFKLRYFSPLEPFWVQMKISLFGAVVLALPVIFWQIWRFIAPGLYANERSFVIRLSFSGVFLFLVGAAFSIAYILPLLMQFSMGFASDALEPAIGLEKFVSLVLMLLFGFGIMFQFPIAVFILVRSGLVKIETLKKQRPVVFIIILFLSAVFTPPDIISQIMMGVPTYLLFEISLLFAGMKKGNEEDDDNDDDDPGHGSEQKKPPEENLPEADDEFISSYRRARGKRKTLASRAPASCTRKRRR